MDIGFAKGHDKEALMGLYDVCFPGESEYNRYFHDNFWRADRTLVAKEGERIVAMVNLIDTALELDDETITATYIYAAATHPDFRGRGIMGDLLNKSFELAEVLGVDISMLITGEDSLFDYYKRFGYQPVFGVSRVEINDEMSFGMNTARMLSAGNGDAARMLTLYNYARQGRLSVKRDEKRFVEILAEYEDHAFGLFDSAGNMLSYCLMNEDNKIGQEVIGDFGGYLLYICCMDMETGYGKGMPIGQGDTPIGCAKALTKRGERVLNSGKLPPYINILFN